MNPVELLSRFGLPLVFGAVLLEQMGLPIPAAPLIVCAGALAADGELRPELVLLAAVLACLAADNAWFLLGRRFGRSLLSGLCRVSLSPDSCVRRSDNLIGRHGAALLLVAKFVPGVSAVSIPTAAASGLKYSRFLRFDSAGALLWCSAYIAIGLIFDREVNHVLDTLARIGGYGMLAVLAVLLIYIGLRLINRWRLRRLYRIVRISVDEMRELLGLEPELVLLDARSVLARTADDAVLLPGAVMLDTDDFAASLPESARGRTVVTFCSCPNEASAALLARRLMDAGYNRVRVLAGGAPAIAAIAAALGASLPAEEFNVAAVAISDTGEALGA